MTPSSAATLLCVAPGSDSRATDWSLYSGENRRLVCFVISSLQVGIQFTAWSGIREQRHYPSENEGLYAEIVELGVVVAESATGTEPQARHFPRRNRLISGVALGALVVEAAPRPGSLITARMALEQGREVFAVPGSPLDPRCRGANHLIRQGATLTENADDVMEVLEGIVRQPLKERELPAIEVPAAAAPDEDELARGRGLVVEKLDPSPVEVDELMRQCHLSAAAVLTILLELELAGRLHRQPGNQVVLLSEGPC